jgi:hypothetical protein
MGKTLLSDKAIFLSTSEKKSKFAKCWKAQLTGIMKRAGRKEYKEKDRGRRENGKKMMERWKMSREKNEYVTPAEVINRKHLCRADLVRNHGNIPKVRKIKVEPFPFSKFTLIFIIPLSLLDIILKLRFY